MKKKMDTIKKLNPFSLLLILFLVFGFSACTDDDNTTEPTPEDDSYLLSVAREEEISRQEIISLLDAYAPELNLSESPASLLIKDLDIVSLTYRTTGVDGQETEASGIIVMPTDTKSYDHLLSIQHATIDMEEAPSLQRFYIEAAPAIMGNIVVMADYLGYGASRTPDRQHPYLHLRSTGTACADMIEAAREYLRTRRIAETANNLKLMGYSQGAHATIATLLELESRGQTSRVKSVQAGGGIYDVAGTLQGFLTAGAGSVPFTGSSASSVPFTDSGYLPYIIRGIAYGEQLSLSDANLYAPELISSGLTKMFSTRPLSEWHAALGADLTRILHPDFFASGFNGNRDILSLASALASNSPVNVTAPTTAVTFYHSRMDDFVPYANSEAMHAHCPNSTLVELTLPGHTRASLEFMLRCMGLWGLLEEK